MAKLFRVSQLMWKMLTYECFSVGSEFLGNGAKSAKFRQMQIVDALRLGDRSSASSMLMELGQEKHSLTADSFVGILRYCARSPDPLVGFVFFTILSCISRYYFFYT